MPSMQTRTFAAHERVTILVLSHQRWNLDARRPQQVMTRVARYCDVIFVEEPVQARGESRLDTRTVAPGVEVLTPRFDDPTAGYADVHLSPLGRLLESLLGERRIRAPLAWFYTPAALPILKFIEPRGIVYDCIEDLAALSSAPRGLRLQERRLVDLADVVITAGPALQTARKCRRPDAHYLPNAVDADHFARSTLDPQSREATLAREVHAAIAGPRLGCAGRIDERVDLQLIDDLAARRPDWSFVMTGPVNAPDVRSLPHRPNIFWLDTPSYELLPHLLRHWNIAMMPLARTAATRCLAPCETLEYLAADLPVVSTFVPDVVALHGPFIRLAEGADDFERVITDMLLTRGRCKQEEPLTRERIALLDASSWEEMVSRLMAAIRPWLGGVLAELPDRRLDAIGLEEPDPRARRSLRSIRTR